jgi:hypothetical protein
MSEPNDRDSADERTEETKMVGRREAVKRFAKYTAPIMLGCADVDNGRKGAVRRQQLQPLIQNR